MQCCPRFVKLHVPDHSPVSAGIRIVAPEMVDLLKTIPTGPKSGIPTSIFFRSTTAYIGRCCASVRVAGQSLLQCPVPQW